ncbi:DNA polymerase III [Chryseobacterium lactis]|uniref:DNA polymerase III n=1 Tax=Chryseobacterium lactis TaxID=1241981 RepID=A0A3G6RC72_CHRLC|nr:3'-5' exonuclease [Chryseobacterium lactis]AZA82279.1 exonuclease domain-containing protein [Chryseobacterium lactis]AZB02661.1 exonuclease domain-containing protein [Chryseobacterium lactis]PNW14047.1 DNA polymerase III [Chryseobacterium lactis]
MKTTNEIIIIDLEATCWENDRIPIGQKVDIIEIGICKLDLTSHTVSRKQSIYVTPERSEINKFCTNLTGITPQLVGEKGIYFEEACERIRDEYASLPLTWAGYGNFDREQIIEQCDWLGIESPFSDQYLDVMYEFKRHFRLHKSIGLKRALDHLNMNFEGNHHSGADDAYNTARILSKILK